MPKVKPKRNYFIGYTSQHGVDSMIEFGAHNDMKAVVRAKQIMRGLNAQDWVLMRDGPKRTTFVVATSKDKP